MIRAPRYEYGLRGFLAAVWQCVRWRTWRAYPPADDRGVERSHAHAPHPDEREERLRR